jgi:hypothetical protein
VSALGADEGIKRCDGLSRAIEIMSCHDAQISMHPTAHGRDASRESFDG